MMSAAAPAKVRFVSSGSPTGALQRHCVGERACCVLSGIRAAAAGSLTADAMLVSASHGMTCHSSVK
jgi:hypothetical protein